MTDEGLAKDADSQGKPVETKLSIMGNDDDYGRPQHCCKLIRSDRLGSLLDVEPELVRHADAATREGDEDFVHVLQNLSPCVRERIHAALEE